MKNARSFLIHEPSFSEIDTRYPHHQQPYNTQNLALISKLIKQTQNESELNINTRVRVSPNTKDAIHNHEAHYILLPYKPEYAGVDYYVFWRHEAEHALQTDVRLHGVESVEKTMLQVSRFLYPADIEDDQGRAKPEYLYNYTELKARTAEACALREALQERYDSKPPDFRYTEKKAYLEAIQRFCENTQGQHSLITCLQYTMSQVPTIIAQPDAEHELPDKNRFSLATFWTTQGMVKNLQAFREFQREYQQLLKCAQQLQHDVQHPESAPTQEAEATKQYNNEMHERTHDMLLHEGCQVIQVIDLPSVLPENATKVHGFDAMIAFIQEYRHDLDKFTICEPIDKNVADAMYIVFNTADLTHSQDARTDNMPEQYHAPEQPDFLDYIEHNVELDEIEEEEIL